MDTINKEELKKDIIRALKQVFDPEIPVNVYDLGLIYGLEIDDQATVFIEMTLTAPNCPIADQVVEEVKRAVMETPKVMGVDVKLVFEPMWDESRMSEEALLDLGLL